MIGFRSYLKGVLILYILSPVRLMNLHPRYPVWVIRQFCFNLISGVTYRGTNFNYPMPFNEPLLFKPTELGHITRFPFSDTRRAGMYTPKQMKIFWDNIIHASASDIVLKKLKRPILTQGNIVRLSDPGNFERLLSPDDRL